MPGATWNSPDSTKDECSGLCLKQTCSKIRDDSTGLFKCNIETTNTCNSEAPTCKKSEFLVRNAPCCECCDNDCFKCQPCAPPPAGFECPAVDAPVYNPMCATVEPVEFVAEETDGYCCPCTFKVVPKSCPAVQPCGPCEIRVELEEATEDDCGCPCTSVCIQKPTPICEDNCDALVLSGVDKNSCPIYTCEGTKCPKTHPNRVEIEGGSLECTVV